ncbi:MAG TPA: J domain-containing protein [Pyrinomonadaceae bacterium]|nr:J domain-containing protein [Pyrinomonadaceae bacterium]
MSQIDSSKDYYDVLGVSEYATREEIDRQYKREAHKHHPDRGGSEERMKSLNEAYGVLKDASIRQTYDLGRQKTARERPFVPVSTPTARDIGVFGHVLSASLCLLAGIFLLMLVRFQWIWFLWPLAILAVFVIGFGVLMARSAMVAVNASLPTTNRFRRHTRFQELVFWSVVLMSIYGIYILFTQ